MLANSEKRTAISGSVFFTSQVEGKDVTAPGVLLVQWPDKVRLEAQDPMGNTLFLLIFNAGNFWMYRSDQPEILTGPLKKYPDNTQLMARADLLVSAFLARPVVAGKFTFLENGAERVEGGHRYQIRWDGPTQEIESIVEEIPGTGKTGFFFEDYGTHAGISFPEKIRMTQPLQNHKSRTATIQWRDWQPFVPDAKNLFQIPQQQTFGRKIKALR